MGKCQCYRADKGSGTSASSVLEASICRKPWKVRACKLLELADNGRDRRRRHDLVVGARPEQGLVLGEGLDLGDLDAAFTQERVGSIDVVDVDLDALQRARLAVDEARSERNGASRAGRHQLHETWVSSM
jgi:hypothetical protein